MEVTGQAQWLLTSGCVSVGKVQCASSKLLRHAFVPCSTRHLASAARPRPGAACSNKERRRRRWRRRRALKDARPRRHAERGPPGQVPGAGAVPGQRALVGALPDRGRAEPAVHEAGVGAGRGHRIALGHLVHGRARARARRPGRHAADHVQGARPNPNPTMAQPHARGAASAPRRVRVLAGPRAGRGQHVAWGPDECWPARPARPLACLSSCPSRDRA